MKVLVGLLISFIVVLLLVAGWAISIKFQAQKFENNLGAVNQNLQNVYSSVDKILYNSGITVKNFGETKIKAIQESIKRYADKPELMMQWVQDYGKISKNKLKSNIQNLNLSKNLKLVFHKNIKTF